MKAVWAIAKLTIREAIRNKILYLLLGFASLLICFSWIIGELTVGDEIKIIKDLCISSIHIFGVFITIFIGISLVFKEMEKRTIYLVISKPIHRYQFLLGKFTGLALTLLAVLLVLVVGFYMVLAARGEPSPRVLLAFYPMYLEWLILSTMLTFSAFLMGHLTESLLMLKEKLTSKVADLFLTGLFYALPNLELFNIRSQMVHNLPLPVGYLFTALLYWILYLGTLLMFAAFLFQKKDFV
jgi:ABC-type transport system involved in multi-copper enzyme maturation permease subunit